MSSEQESKSYLFGVFCALLGQLEELVLPDMKKKGVDWAEDALLLFETNPDSMMQLAVELLKKVPEHSSKDNNDIVDDLVLLYNQLDTSYLKRYRLDQDDFIEGYESIFLDFSEEEEKSGMLPKIADVEAVDVSFLLGLLLGKIQYMDETNNPHMEKKGEAFVDSFFLLFSTNVESSVQILQNIVQHLPSHILVGHIFLTLNEIVALFDYVSVERLHTMSIDERMLKKGYAKQVEYFSDDSLRNF